MNSVSKAILIAFGALLALLAIALIGANLYIQSPPAQLRIQTALSQALRVPLKITNTSVSPWGELRINGIAIPADGVNFLEAASFRASYRLLPLLGGHLVISAVTLDSPKIVWIQNADGQWKLPTSQKAAAVSEKSPPKPPEALGEKPPAKAGFSVSVGSIEVKDGSIELLDAKKKRLAYFIGVHVRCPVATAERVEGLAEITRATWRETVALENLRGAFTRTDDTLRLSELTGTLGGGEFRGSYARISAGAGAGYEGALEFDNADLDRLTVEAGGQPRQAAGKLSGRLDLRGPESTDDRLQGSGKVNLREGRLRQLELFQTIGQVLGIRELADFQLTDAHADFHLAGEKILVDQLLLAAPDLALTASGSVRLDKKVALEAQLAVEDSMVKQLPSVVRDSFGTADDGRRTIAFNVSGSTDKLKTNLLDKLIGQKITSQFDDLLSGLFGKKDDKKKEEDERKKADKERRKKEKAQAAPGSSSSSPASTAVPLTTPDPAAPPAS